MRLRREIRWMIGALIALNLLLAFGAIGLFMRMGPAIERILLENVFSIVAAENMLARLAEAGGGALSPSARESVIRSLADAQANVTEDEEIPVLATIEGGLPNALAGEDEARRATVAAVLELIRINRQAMGEVDLEARRLGAAGAWAAVFVGFTAFLLGILVVDRFRSRVVHPLVELHEVLEAARRGDRFRRCRLAGAPQEVVQITQLVNTLLDERLDGARIRADHRPPR